MSERPRSTGGNPSDRGRPPRRTPPRTRTGDLSTWETRRIPPARPRTEPPLYMVVSGRALVALVATIVLVATGYGWTQLRNLSGGLATEDVIDPKAQAPLGEQNILLVGLDTRHDAQGNPLPADLLDQLHAGTSSDGGDNTDTMIVIHIPAGGGQAVAFSLPRDSYVSIAGGYGMHKINSAYSYGENAAHDKLVAQGLSGPALATAEGSAGAKNAIQTVERVTGLTINHFAGVNLAGFYYISQAVGGVEVCLKSAVHDHYSGANFPAGTSYVSGSTALEFVRQRHGLPNGDLDRIKRQQAFMSSMAKTVLSAGLLTDPGKLDALIGAVKKAVVLDKGWDILSFAQHLENMSAGNMHFLTIPIVNITYPTPSDGDAVEVDPSQIQSFIQQNINPTRPSSPAPTSAAASSTNAAVTVDVIDGNGQTHLAATVSDQLAAAGYTKGEATTGTTRTTTVVEYASGQSTAARQIATTLGGNIPTEPDSALSAGHVRVYLGKNYQASGGNTTPQDYVAAAPPTTTDGVPCIN